MELQETKSCSGYGKPPWIFKGSALYQFHLVKAEIARAIIPKQFRLVEAFGYTLGGFFLANYNDSPVGTFDELVVMAGIVWNPPISHTWAARVYVNSDEACRHGRKEFGLPSEVARFSKGRKGNGLLTSSIGVGTENGMDIEAAAGEMDGNVLKRNPWMGLQIKMSLPSFSGHTEYNPQLLKYYCQIECRVKPRWPARVVVVMGNGTTEEKVMLSKPILALQFNCLNMMVQPPVIVSPPSPTSSTGWILIAK